MADISPLSLKPTTKLMVMLGKRGLQLLNPTPAGVLALKFHELVAISELDSGEFLSEQEVSSCVAAKTGVEESEVAKFLRLLVRTGRLRRRRKPIYVREPVPSLVSSAIVAQSVLDCLIALNLPLAVRLSGGKFQFIDHEGHCLIELTAAELMALNLFVQPQSFFDGMEKQSALLAGNAIEESRLLEILLSLHCAGLLSLDEDKRATDSQVVQVNYQQAIKANFARQAIAQDEREALRHAQTGKSRTKVIPVSFGEAVPAALGLIVSYAKVYNDGSLDEFYDFRLDWFWDDDRLANFSASPAIYLFSNYLWTHQNSITVSEKVKRLSPASITIHGGPDTPKYPEDARAYFDKFPHVDIIVRGEGEGAAAETLDKLRSVIGQQSPDLSVLNGVAGISYRHKGEIIRNPDRARIVDLDTIPSPYVAGLFDAFEGLPLLHVTLETNRGCPYGCTFCDWGSATTSKIRLFALARVFGELEWCSRMKVQSVSEADANFGVFERDVFIAEKVAELKLATGYPETFGGSYAKNSTKYLQKIIRVLADAGILAQGVLSLQTMDAATLEAIDRSNIKVEKYDALANEMRDSKLALTVELMMGLPGATLQSFIEDLQQCIDRDIPARINHTTLLVNSPMNNPEYRAKHQIETGSELGPGKMPVLVSTSSYSREDLGTMLDLRQVYILLDNFGVMRLCSRFVRQQTGLSEMNFYHKVFNEAGSYELQHKWPLLNTLVHYGQHLMAPPYSWALLYAELREYLIQECGVPEGSALDTIITTQRAIMPSYGRVFPYHVELQHDVVAWHSQMLAAKAAGHWRNWQEVVPALSSFGPGTLAVNDINGMVTQSLGCRLDINAGGVNWDMDSGIGRARVDMDFNSSYFLKEDNTEVVTVVGAAV
jgi:radical SAM superfamily enzyme YgiQ (UPF0313 family)